MNNYVNDQVNEVVCNLNMKVNNSIEEFILTEINQANLDENIEVNIQKILEAMRANQTEDSIREDERRKFAESVNKAIAQLKERRDYYEKKNHTLFVETNSCINIVSNLLLEEERG